MKRLLAGFLCLLCCLIPVRAESPDEHEIQPVGYIALTFDDGPSGPLTEQLLDGLRDRGARATFFLCSYRIDRYPSVLARYEAEGHEVGAHSTVHADLTELSAEAVKKDMSQTVQKIYETTGLTPTVMRPPGGAYDDTVLKTAEEEGLSVILWSVDTRDWAKHSAAEVLHTMAGKAQNGDVILMHDMSKSSVLAALQFVDTMQEQGYCFVTVSELAALMGTELTPGTAYRRFPQQ